LVNQLTSQIVNLKQDIDDRAKDHADSLSQYDLSYPLSCVAVHDDVIYSGSLDREIVGIDIKTRQTRFRVMASYKVKCILVMPSLGHIFAGAENIIQCWEVSTSEKLGEYHGHDQRVTCLREEVDTQLISASDDGTLRRWDRKKLNCTNVYKVCQYPIAAFECLDGHAYCATWDSYIRCIDLKNGETKYQFRDHEKEIQALTLLPRDSMNSNDQAMYEAKNVKGVMYSAGSAIDKKVKNVKCVQDHLVLGWEIGDDDIYEKNATSSFFGHLDCVFCVAVLDVPEFVKTLTGENSDPPEGALDPAAEACKPLHNIPENDLMALKDAEMPKRIIITGSDDRSVRLFDCETGMCMLVLIGHTDGVSSLCISGGILYSASFDRTIRSWHLLEALVRIQMRRKLKKLETLKLAQETIIEENSKKKKKGKKKKKK